jgi:hypothetical protein
MKIGEGGGGGKFGSNLERDAIHLQLKTNFIYLVKYFRFNNIDILNLYVNLTYKLELHNKF